jgi:hypothetical protein
MASERVQRQIDRLLDEAEEAFAKRDWQVVRDNARDVIGLDPANQDALTFFNAAEQALNNTEADQANPPPRSSSSPATPATETTPTPFANGRYEVKRFLGEGSP